MKPRPALVAPVAGSISSMRVSIPDILVVSKTAGNGYPAAAVIVSDEVAESLETQGFSHLSSHQNDPLAAAAVHAVIDIVENEGLVQHSADVGLYLWIDCGHFSKNIPSSPKFADGG